MTVSTRPNLTQLKQHIADKLTARPDATGQCDYWYDWFCKDTTLARKTPQLAKRAIKVAEALGLDLDGYYMSLKNNCPAFDGSLYDTIRLFPIDESKPSFAITPKSGHNAHMFRAELHAWMPNRSGVEENFNSWNALLTALEQKTTKTQTVFLATL